MVIPAWALLGLLSASLVAAMMLLQEKLKVDGFALAVWCKVACIIVAFPFVLMSGLPTNPIFYMVLSGQALLFAISDVIMFKNIPKIGAGVISRVFPVTVIIGFLLWFVIEPSLFLRYLESPVISVLILAVLCLTVYFAMHLKQCQVSMQAIRILWFPLLANIIGPILAKLITNYASIEQGPLAFTFVESWMMIAMWFGYFLVARPITPAAFFARQCWQGGLIIGAVMAAMIIVYVAGFYYVDNPGYISAIRLLDAVIILAIYRLMGRQDDSNIKAGLGLVGCAIALIVLKTQIQ